MLIDLADLDNIIRNQSVSSPDQLQCSLTLSDSALTRDQKSLAIYIDQYAVYGNTRCKLLTQTVDQLRGKLRSRSACAKDRDLFLVRQPKHHLIRLKIPAINNARNIIR